MNNENVTTVVKTGETLHSKSNKTVKAGKHGRFNLVDFFLIIIVLALIAAAVSYFLPGISKRLAGANDVEITYSLEITGVEDKFLSRIAVGDVVYDSGNNYAIGTVKTVEQYAYTELYYNEETGVLETKEHPDLKNIVITISASAIYNSGEGYSINGTRMAVGKSYNIRFPEYAAVANCIELSARAN